MEEQQVIHIKCPKCNGVGTLPLGDEMLVVLKVVQDSGQNGITTKKVYEICNLDLPQVARGRLEKLVRLGFVEKRPTSSSLRWVIACAT